MAVNSKKKIWYFIKNYKFNSIIIRNFALILILVIILIGGIGFYIYGNMKSAVEEEISTISMNSLYKVRDVTDNLFKDMDRMATQLSLHERCEYVLSVFGYGIYPGEYI